MFKKLFISIFMLGALSFMLSARVFAQSYLLGMVEVKFCNYQQTNKELDLISKAGNKLPICVEFTNKAITPIIINVDFLDSVITDDGFKDRACNAADRPKKNFGNFMLPYKGEVTLPPQQTIQKEFIIQHPIGFSGLSHGCLAYNIVGADINNKEMFTIRIRSIKYIDIFVANSDAVQMIYMSKTPSMKKVGDEYIITLGVNNKGNVDEKVHIISKLSNILGYQKTFTFDVSIPANTGIIINTPSFVLPAYGGLFWLSNTISYTPEFNFNVTNGKKPSDIYAGGTKETQNIFFIWTRQSRVTIIVLLLFAYVTYGAIRKTNIINKKSIKKS